MLTTPILSECRQLWRKVMVAGTWVFFVPLATTAFVRWGIHNGLFLLLSFQAYNKLDKLSQVNLYTIAVFVSHTYFICLEVWMNFEATCMSVLPGGDGPQSTLPIVLKIICRRETTVFPHFCNVLRFSVLFIVFEVDHY